MSIENTKIVDAIGVDDIGVAVLTISDHLEWNDRHLYLLQEKINTYLVFVESGQIYEAHPESKGRDIGIHLVCKYEPTAVAHEFISQCAGIVQQAGIGFCCRVGI